MYLMDGVDDDADSNVNVLYHYNLKNKQTKHAVSYLFSYLENSLQSGYTPL